MMATPRLHLRKCIGQPCTVAGRGEGILRFYGRTSFQPGEWCGVELNAAKGKNDGMVAGRRYFNCKSRHGVFVMPNVVSILSGGQEKGADRQPSASASPTTSPLKTSSSPSKAPASPSSSAPASSAGSPAGSSSKTGGNANTTSSSPSHKPPENRATEGAESELPVPEPAKDRPRSATTAKPQERTTRAQRLQLEAVKKREAAAQQRRPRSTPTTAATPTSKPTPAAAATPAAKPVAKPAATASSAAAPAAKAAKPKPASSAKRTAPTKPAAANTTNKQTTGAGTDPKVTIDKTESAQRPEPRAKSRGMVGQDKHASLQDGQNLQDGHAPQQSRKGPEESPLPSPSPAAAASDSGGDDGVAASAVVVSSISSSSSALLGVTELNGAEQGATGVRRKTPSPRTKRKQQPEIPASASSSSCSSPMPSAGAGAEAAATTVSVEISDHGDGTSGGGAEFVTQATGSATQATPRRQQHSSLPRPSSADGGAGTGPTRSLSPAAIQGHASGLPTSPRSGSPRRRRTASDSDQVLPSSPLQRLGIPSFDASASPDPEEFGATSPQQRSPRSPRSHRKLLPTPKRSAMSPPHSPSPQSPALRASLLRLDLGDTLPARLSTESPAPEAVSCVDCRRRLQRLVITDQEVAELRRLYHDAQASNLVLEAQLDAARDQVSAFQEIKMRHREAESQRKGLVGQLEAAKQALKTTIKQIKQEHADAMDALQQRLAQAQSEKTTLRAELGSQHEAEVRQQQLAFEKELRETKAQLDDARTELDELRHSLKDATESKKQLAEDLASARADAESQAKATDREVSELKDQLAERDREVQALQQASQREKDDAAARQQQLDSLNAELKTKRDEIEQLMSSAELGQSEQAAAMSQSETHSAQLKHRDEHIQELKREISLLEERNTRLSSELARERARMEELERSQKQVKESLEGELTQMEADWSRSATRYQEDVRSLESVVADLRAKLEAAQSGSDAGANARHMVHEERVRAMQGEHNTAMQAIRRELEVALAQARDWEQHAKQLQQQQQHHSSASSQELDAAQRRAQHLEAELRRVAADKASTVDQLRREKATLSTRLEHAENQVAALRTKQQERPATVVHSNSELTPAKSPDMKTKLQQEESIRKLRDELEMTRNRLREWEQRATQLEQGVQDDPEQLHAQNRKLAEQYDCAKFELESIRHVLEMKNVEQKEMRQSIATLERKLEEKQSSPAKAPDSKQLQYRVEELQGALETRRRTYESLASEHGRTQQQLRELEVVNERLAAEAKELRFRLETATQPQSPFNTTRSPERPATRNGATPAASPWQNSPSYGGVTMRPKSSGGRIPRPSSSTFG